MPARLPVSSRQMSSCDQEALSHALTVWPPPTRSRQKNGLFKQFEAPMDILELARVSGGCSAVASSGPSCGRRERSLTASGNPRRFVKRRHTEYARGTFPFAEARPNLSYPCSGTTPSARRPHARRRSSSRAARCQLRIWEQLTRKTAQGHARDRFGLFKRGLNLR